MARVALPRVVALSSGLVSVKFRGAVVLSRVTPAAAAQFMASWDGSGGRTAYPPVAGVSAAERCREYRGARRAAVRLAVRRVVASFPVRVPAALKTPAPASIPVLDAAPASAASPARPSILRRMCRSLASLAARLVRSGPPSREFRSSAPPRPMAAPRPRFPASGDFFAGA